MTSIQDQFYQFLGKSKHDPLLHSDAKRVALIVLAGLQRTDGVTPENIKDHLVQITGKYNAADQKYLNEAARQLITAIETAAKEHTKCLA